MDHSAWDQMIIGLRNGDQETCSKFWNEFGPMLENVASRQLSERIQRRVGPNDVAQSVCRTFFRRVSSGQFDLPDSDALWRLMCAITLNKARSVARDHAHPKQGSESEPSNPSAASDSAGKLEFQRRGELPFDANMFSDQMSLLLEDLSPQECQVLDLKLQNQTNEHIASQMECSERTVRRLTNQIRARWNAFFDEERGQSGGQFTAE